MISMIFFLLFVFFVAFIFLIFFFFNDTATTEIYTLSLHDALPIRARPAGPFLPPTSDTVEMERSLAEMDERARSEEHTSELQSLAYLVCRLLLEKKKKKKNDIPNLQKKKNTKTY